MWRNRGLAPSPPSRATVCGSGGLLAPPSDYSLGGLLSHPRPTHPRPAPLSVFSVAHIAWVCSLASLNPGIPPPIPPLSALWSRYPSSRDPDRGGDEEARVTGGPTAPSGSAKPQPNSGPSAHQSLTRRDGGRSGAPLPSAPST